MQVVSRQMKFLSLGFGWLLWHRTQSFAGTWWQLSKRRELLWQEALSSLEYI
jgi:hypothetical protein